MIPVNKFGHLKESKCCNDKRQVSVGANQKTEKKCSLAHAVAAQYFHHLEFFVATATATHK